ncbi:MAG: hypothetical protein Rhirs2KO_04840 [Rhizobiaceae bacterium]
MITISRMPTVLSLAGSRKLRHARVGTEWAYPRRWSEALIAAALLVFTSLLVFPAAAAPELLALQDTDFPPPNDAIYVATTGDDLNIGSLDKPFRTVGAAIKSADPGGTVVIRTGTYREHLPDIDKRLTLQPYPNEKVWLKGSIIVGGWVKDGTVWRKDGWSYDFCRSCYDPRNIDPAYPHAGLPEQTFVDGEPLKQVGRRSALRSGTFFVDGDAETLFIGNDPTGKVVEASVHATAITLWQGAEGSAIRGLGFAHYSPIAEPGLGGAVKVNADRVTLHANTFAWSAVKGVEIFGKDCIVVENRFLYNGMMGLAAWRADGLDVRRNLFAFNNHEGFVRTGVVSEAAGAKVTSSGSVTFANNRFEQNRATGLWLDINVSDVTVVRNEFRDNAHHGIHVELSSHAHLVSNLIASSGVSGVVSADSTDVSIYNNALLNNEISLVVQDDERINDDPVEIDKGNSWITRGNRFLNNLVAANSISPVIWVRDFTGLSDAEDMLGDMSHNAYLLSEHRAGGAFAIWWRGNQENRFATLEDFQRGTSRDTDSVMIANELGGELTYRSISELALPVGGELPPKIAAAIGWRAVGPPNVGLLP